MLRGLLSHRSLYKKRKRFYTTLTYINVISFMDIIFSIFVKCLRACQFSEFYIEVSLVRNHLCFTNNDINTLYQYTG